MVSVSLRDITKRFGGTVAVDGVTIDIGRGELFFLLGPSGCGKSTLLRTVAGFCGPDEGTVLFDARDVTRLPPHERNTGMVFQNYALWPHMTVEENVAYGLEVRKIRGPDRARRVREALGMVRMADYADRRPNQLSGGQQQRIALARALVIRPDVVLLDEPLSNLDARLRIEMRDEIRRIHRDVEITTIYVTHDQKEALSMADRVAVLRGGRVEQVGSPREIYSAPSSPFVAQFIGETNLVPGRVSSRRDGWVQVSTAMGEIRSSRPIEVETGAAVVCSIRPEALRLLCGHPAGDGSVVVARVESLTYLGEVDQVDLCAAGGQRLRALELNPWRAPRAGDEVKLFVRSEDVIVLREGAV